MDKYPKTTAFVCSLIGWSIGEALGNKFRTFGLGDVLCLTFSSYLNYFLFWSPNSLSNRLSGVKSNK